MNMYKNIEYLLYSSHKILKLIYKIYYRNVIKIFGEEFVINNRRKCLIIYKGKIFPFRSYFLLNDINKEDKENKKFEILLLELEDASNKSYMFYECNSLVEFTKYELNINEIKNDTIKKENYLESDNTNKYKEFYQNDIDEETINKNDSNLSKETIKSITKGLNIIFKTKRKYYSYLKYMNHMFQECLSLVSLPDISEWNTKNVKDMSYVFYKCSSLIFLYGISEWNTNNVKDMTYMFGECSSLVTLPNISKWVTNNVNNMSFMFSRCSSLTV